jgi:hypothetical protein
MVNMNRYYYPDGTQGTIKPRDGEIFRLTDRTDGSVSEWQYDGYKEQWCRRPTGPTVISGIISLNDECEIIDPTGIDWSGFQTKCECGSEKCGSTAHSTWCPKYST